jgi:hypothetical protein
LRGGVLYIKVHELISPITATWDEDLLRDIFNPVDVERILQIPINNHELMILLLGEEQSMDGIR